MQLKKIAVSYVKVPYLSYLKMFQSLIWTKMKDPRTRTEKLNVDNLIRRIQI